MIFSHTIIKMAEYLWCNYFGNSGIYWRLVSFWGRFTWSSVVNFSQFGFLAQYQLLCSLPSAPRSCTHVSGAASKICGNQGRQKRPSSPNVMNLCCDPWFILSDHKDTEIVSISLCLAEVTFRVLKGILPHLCIFFIFPLS
jgi:hypothetical protein